MHLQFDQQLSVRLCELLAETYPASLHVRMIGLGGASDEAVWSILRFASQDEATFLALGSGTPSS